MGIGHYCLKCEQTLSEGLDIIEMPQFLSGQLRLELCSTISVAGGTSAAAEQPGAWSVTQTMFFSGLTRWACCGVTSLDSDLYLTLHWLSVWLKLGVLSVLDSCPYLTWWSSCSRP